MNRRIAAGGRRRTGGGRRSGVSVRLLGLAAALVLALLMLATVAFADGDPGSDVLVNQSLFTFSGMSITQELHVGALLTATQKAGAPIKVAVISERGALGTVTSLWQQPQSYSNYLAKELKDTYSGRLLVIMPGGFGYEWWSNRPAGPDQMATAMRGVPVQGVTGAKAVATVTEAVDRIEAAAGVSKAKLASLMTSSGAGANGAGAATQPGSGARQGTGSGKSAGAQGTDTATSAKHKLPTGWFAVVIVLLLGLYVAYRMGRLKDLHLPRRYGRSQSEDGEQRGGLFGLGISPLALVPTTILLVVLVVVLVQGGGGSSASQTQLLAENSGLDAGTPFSGNPTAPNFKLPDETGREISLKQYRGKVVILSFIDSECETICPLTSAAMLDAKRDLGAAGKDVQLLAVNANWKSTQVQDVINYTYEHGMLHKWHFLTGSTAQLEKVWNRYGVNELKLLKRTGENTRDIDHEAATFIISPQGRMSRVFTTYSAYSAIPQFGQLLAKDASALLPSHPKVDTKLSYASVSGITPAETATLPRVGGGHIDLGPGKGHLYVFFATWDQQTSGGKGLASRLLELNRYERFAAKNGLPSATAIDEGTVEPNARALPAFLDKYHVLNKLDYPVAVDASGRVADGYDVEGQPWYVLVTPSGHIADYQEVYTDGWPSLKLLERSAEAAVRRVSTGPTTSSKVRQDLGGSPPPLAALHKQSGQLLTGGVGALQSRIRALRGYPVVVNVWSSICLPCQKEFGLFEHASAQLGANVAFLGADNGDQAPLAKAFLRAHQVYYPSYQTSDISIEQLIRGGLVGTPTTLFYNAQGKLTKVSANAFTSQSELDSYIDTYALGETGCSSCG